MDTDEHSPICTFAKSDAKKQIVYGMVYAPDLLDAHGDMMMADTIEEMAHAFLRKTDLGSSIDKEHQSWPQNCYPVESWIQKGEDPEGVFLEGAWCMGVKIDDPVIWSQIEKGEINGFSMAGTAARRKVVVEYDYEPIKFGETDPAEDGHTHKYVVKVDETGKPTWSSLSVAADGHTHVIQKGTATMAAPDGHKHRINIKSV